LRRKSQLNNTKPIL